MGARVLLLLAALLVLLVSVPVDACPGANPHDRLADNVAIQRCLDAGGTVTLKYGKPGYIINQSLVIKHSRTRLTSDSAPAKLIAGNELNGPILFAQNLHRFVIQNLQFDGNKAGRKDNPCIRISGNTVVILNSTHFVFADNKIINTLCGTSLLVTGSDYVVTRNTIKNGGSEPMIPAHTYYADGITAGKCERGIISKNVLKNNTDVAIITGGGAGCRVVDNKIKQTTARASAGIWIFNFSCGDCGRGNHAASLVARNKVVSTMENGLGAGIVAGGHILSEDLWVENAGTIVENNIAGAGVNMLVDGVRAGTIAANKTSNPRGKAGSIYFGNGCGNQEHYNFTSAHAGNTVLQPGWIPKFFDSYSCSN